MHIIGVCVCDGSGGVQGGVAIQRCRCLIPALVQNPAVLLPGLYLSCEVHNKRKSRSSVQQRSRWPAHNDLFTRLHFKKRLFFSLRQLLFKPWVWSKTNLLGIITRLSICFINEWKTHWDEEEGRGETRNDGHPQRERGWGWSYKAGREVKTNIKKKKKKNRAIKNSKRQSNNWK